MPSTSPPLFPLSPAARPPLLLLSPLLLSAIGAGRRGCLCGSRHFPPPYQAGAQAMGCRWRAPLSAAVALHTRTHRHPPLPHSRERKETSAQPQRRLLQPVLAPGLAPPPGGTCSAAVAESSQNVQRTRGEHKWVAVGKSHPHPPCLLPSRVQSASVAAAPLPSPAPPPLAPPPRGTHVQMCRDGRRRRAPPLQGEPCEHIRRSASWGVGPVDKGVPAGHVEAVSWSRRGRAVPFPHLATLPRSTSARLAVKPSCLPSAVAVQDGSAVPRPCS